MADARLPRLTFNYQKEVTKAREWDQEHPNETPPSKLKRTGNPLRNRLAPRPADIVRLIRLRKIAAEVFGIEGRHNIDDSSHPLYDSGLVPNPESATSWTRHEVSPEDCEDIDFLDEDNSGNTPGYGTLSASYFLIRDFQEQRFAQCTNDGHWMDSSGYVYKDDAKNLLFEAVIYYLGLVAPRSCQADSLDAAIEQYDLIYDFIDRVRRAPIFSHHKSQKTHLASARTDDGFSKRPMKHTTEMLRELQDNVRLMQAAAVEKKLQQSVAERTEGIQGNQNRIQFAGLYILFKGIFVADQGHTHERVPQSLADHHRRLTAGVPDNRASAVATGQYDTELAPRVAPLVQGGSAVPAEFNATFTEAVTGITSHYTLELSTALDAYYRESVNTDTELAAADGALRSFSGDLSKLLNLFWQAKQQEEPFTVVRRLATNLGEISMSPVREPLLELANLYDTVLSLLIRHMTTFISTIEGFGTSVHHAQVQDSHTQDCLKLAKLPRVLKRLKKMLGRLQENVQDLAKHLRDFDDTKVHALFEESMQDISYLAETMPKQLEGAYQALGLEAPASLLHLKDNPAIVGGKFKALIDTFGAGDASALPASDAVEELGDQEEGGPLRLTDVHVRVSDLAGPQRQSTLEHSVHLDSIDNKRRGILADMFLAFKRANNGVLPEILSAAYEQIAEKSLSETYANIIAFSSLLNAVPQFRETFLIYTQLMEAVDGEEKLGKVVNAARTCVPLYSEEVTTQIDERTQRTLTRVEAIKDAIPDVRIPSYEAGDIDETDAAKLAELTTAHVQLMQLRERITTPEDASALLDLRSYTVTEASDGRSDDEVVLNYEILKGHFHALLEAPALLEKLGITAYNPHGGEGPTDIRPYMTAEEAHTPGTLAHSRLLFMQLRMQVLEAPEPSTTLGEFRGEYAMLLKIIMQHEDIATDLGLMRTLMPMITELSTAIDTISTLAQQSCETTLLELQELLLRTNELHEAITVFDRRVQAKKHIQAQAQAHDGAGERKTGSLSDDESDSDDDSASYSDSDSESDEDIANAIPTPPALLELKAQFKSVFEEASTKRRHTLLGDTGASPAAATHAAEPTQPAGRSSFMGGLFDRRNRGDGNRRKRRPGSSSHGKGRRSSAPPAPASQLFPAATAGAAVGTPPRPPGGQGR